MVALKRIIGLDYGAKRIGIAVSDPMNIIARPVGVITNDANVFKNIADYVREFAASLIVVGMPYSLKGGSTEKGKEVLEFIRKLKAGIQVEVKTVDERFTSMIAQKSMLTMGATKKQRRQKHRIDEMASALILQSYLDQTR
jgi:putative Holliday junction resolvase